MNTSKAYGGVDLGVFYKVGGKCVIKNLLIKNITLRSKGAGVGALIGSIVGTSGGITDAQVVVEKCGITGVVEGVSDSTDTKGAGLLGNWDVGRQRQGFGCI